MLNFSNISNSILTKWRRKINLLLLESLSSTHDKNFKLIQECFLTQYDDLQYITLVDYPV